MISPSPTSPTMDHDHVKREFAVTNQLNPIFTSSNHSTTFFATQNSAAAGGGSGTGSPTSCTESTTPLADDDGQVDEYINYNAVEEEEQEEQEDFDEDEYFNSFPPGYRFKPHDEELVVYYLKRKIYNRELPRNRIKQVELYKYNPDTLAAKYKANGEDEWYFFTPRDRKYPNGDRPNRAAGNGFWKATGADKPIMFKGTKVGLKKSLVFYRGKPPRGDKTDWIMHEYKLIDAPKRRKVSQNDMKLDDWVLCKIRKKDKKSDKSFKASSESQGAQSSDANSALQGQSSDHASPLSENVAMSSSPCNIPINGGFNSTRMPLNTGVNQGAAGLVNSSYMGAPHEPNFHYDHNHHDPIPVFAQQMNNIAIGSSSHNMMQTSYLPWLDNASSPRIPSFHHTMMQTPSSYELDNYLTNHVSPFQIAFQSNELDQLIHNMTDEKDFKNI